MGVSVTLREWKLVVAHVIWAISCTSGVCKTSQERNKDDKQKRCELSKQDCERSFFLLILSTLTLIVLLLLTHMAPLISKDITAKEHVEDFLRVNSLLELVLAEVLSLMLWGTLVVSWLFPCQIVHLAFLRVCQTSICCAYFLKRVSCLWSMVLIGVELYR